MAADYDGDLDDFELTKDEIEQNINESLKNVLVFGHSTAFGLKWRTGNVDFADLTLGSWLYRKTGKNKKSQLFFFTLDDGAGEFKGNKNEYEPGKNPFSFAYSDIKEIHLRVNYDPYAVSFVVEAESAGKKGSVHEEWWLSPVQDNDPEVVINWVAALRHRAKLFDDSLLLDHTKALKAAIWAQSMYRKWKAIEKVKRRKERREGIVNGLKAAAFSFFYGGDGYYDSESDSEDEGDNVKRVPDEDGYGFTNLVSTIMNETYYSFMGADDAAEADMNSMLQITGKTKRGKDTLQKRYDAEAISMDEIEDEVWENQNWNIAKKKWVPADFSDRINRVKKKTLEEVAPVPKDWEVTREFEVDLSGLNRKKCGKDGWVYHQRSFAKLCDDFMAGKVQIKPSPTSTVRRRRWFQRRKYIGDIVSDSKVIWHGYLRRKAEGTGRWNTRYYVLTKGLVQNGRITGVCISQFRKGVTDHLNIIGRRDMDQLAALTQKEIKTWNLEAGFFKEN
mmetsp:Transcript_14259/g.17320  ORF Transcript_14259/g.17320 Transcript_14259/m.17320 type:complete len:504 (-) Transcript_14259:1799-3310(-)